MRNDDGLRSDCASAKADIPDLHETCGPSGNFECEPSRVKW